MQNITIMNCFYLYDIPLYIVFIESQSPKLFKKFSPKLEKVLGGPLFMEHSLVRKTIFIE